MSIWRSSVPTEWGHTFGSLGALISKQTGMISRVQKRLKNSLQRIWWSSQWSLWSKGAGRAVARRQAVRWRGPAAGGCQWCHVEAFTHSVKNTLLLRKQNKRKHRWRSGLPQAINLSLTMQGAFAAAFYKTLVHCGSVVHSVGYTVLHSSFSHKWQFVTGAKNVTDKLIRTEDPFDLHTAEIRLRGL